jgi:dolichyl-phosphate beta-glucosyltransferase
VELQPCRGKGGALKAGMTAASGKYRFFTDADLATPAATIWQMLPILEGGAEHVIGSRRHRDSRLLQRQGAAREFLGSIFTALSNAALGTRVSDFTCGFKGYSASAAEAIYGRLSVFRWAYDAEAIFIAKRLGIPIAEVPVTWADVEGSKVQTLKAVYQSLFDLAVIRWRGMKGCYD